MARRPLRDRRAAPYRRQHEVVVGGNWGRPGSAAWQCGLAFVCGELGMEDEARRLLDAHIGAALEVGGHAGSWVVGARVLAELSAPLCRP